MTLAQELARAPKLRRRQQPTTRAYVKARLAEIRKSRTIAFPVENDRSVIVE